MNTYIRIKNASIDFEIGNQIFASNKKKFRALNNINLELSEGDWLGIIGNNGAGKSTLLKMMAGIYPPSVGSCESNGHICPMFELATGFEMELTGWDNIKIRAMLLGMSPAQINNKLDEIAEFSELGSFLEQPVKTFSSGMFMRLAFAVSTAFEPQILLLDEVVGTGDATFYAKAKERMDQFIESGKIIVFTSHSMDLIKFYCNKTLVLNKGEIITVADNDTAITTYQELIK